MEKFCRLDEARLGRVAIGGTETVAGGMKQG
jgi:hypothetical protein